MEAEPFQFSQPRCTHARLSPLYAWKRAEKMEGELWEAELDALKAAVQAKDLSLKSLEEEKRLWEQEAASSRALHEEKQKECEALGAQLAQLEQQCREQCGTITRLKQRAAASERQQQAEAEALRREAGQHRKRATDLEQLLEAAKSAQDSSLERLQGELREREQELAQSREAATGAVKELATLRALAQEKVKSEEGWKEQVSSCLQEGERKASLISSLEQELSILHKQLLEREAESKNLRQQVLAKSEKSKKLEERLRLLQSKMATAATRAAERCSALKTDAQSCQDQAEKLRGASEALKKGLGAHAKREEELCQNAPRREGGRSLLVIGDSIVRNTERGVCDGCEDRTVTCLPGAKVVDVTSRIDKLVKSAGGEVAVVVHVGTNDVGKCGRENLEAKFRLLGRLLKARTPKVAFSEVLPVPRAGPARQAELRGLNAWMRQWCREEGFRFVRHWGTFWDKPGLYKRDGLHLNRNGTRLLALNIKKVAEQLLN